MAEVKTSETKTKELFHFILRERSGTHVEEAVLGDKKGIYYVVGGQVFPSIYPRDKTHPDKFVQVDKTKKITATFVPRNEGEMNPSLAAVAEDAINKMTNPPKPETPAVTKQALETFDSMTMDELKQHNIDEELGLDPKKYKTKEEFAKAIKDLYA